MYYQFTIAQLRPLIAWPYYYHAWQTAGHAAEAELREEAEALLDGADPAYRVRAAIEPLEAYSEGDDIVAGGVRLPMLRQQQPEADGHCLCLSDYCNPQGSTIAVFATSATTLYPPRDIYRDMAAQLLADRLAEAAAEALEQYRPVPPRQDYAAIRPAVGYPSMPDQSINFLLDRLLPLSSVGITLTETGAMQPHASVSGLMLAAPHARYFRLGPIDHDQIADYARRRGMDIDDIKRFLRC